MQLMFVCPLVEKSEEKKDVAPYGYDVIYIELMDNETYDMVMRAARNNLTNAVTVIYRASYVCYFALIALTVYVFLFNLITYANSGFSTALSSSLFYSASYIAGCVLATGLQTLVSIKYKKYKNQ